MTAPRNHLYTIALTLIPGIGPQNAKQLIAHCGSEEAVFNAHKEKLLRIPGIGEFTAHSIATTNALHQAEEELKFIEKHNIEVLHYQDPSYPATLKECNDSPILLYYRGNQPFPEVNRRWISIVGTRRATPYGREFVQQLLSNLKARGHQLTIVSGLAHGIDGEAHKAALANQFPTIGVMGHGLADFYPAAHRNLGRKMLDQGGILTEFISTQHADKSTFLQRNRIIAGLSYATIVVESAIKGGAMVTAKFAAEYNRDVLTLPGNAGREASAGCNQLIKKHIASMIECAEDLEETLNWKPKSPQTHESSTLFYQPTEEEQILLKTLRSGNGMTVDEILRATKLPINRVNAMLLNLEFQNLVHQLPGRLYEISN